MRQIASENLNETLSGAFTYKFTVPEDGLYIIEIIASAQSWWQNTKSFRRFLNDFDLEIIIDGKGFILDRDPAVWNGNTLKGLAKTLVIITGMSKGEHTLVFYPDRNPILQSVIVYRSDSETELAYVPTQNNPPQDGHIRPWMTIILSDVSVKQLQVIAKCLKYPHGREDDDLQILIGGERERNTTKKSHTAWYWCGKVLKGEEKEFNKDLNLGSGLHAIELWADKMPTVKHIRFKLKAHDQSEVPAKVIWQQATIRQKPDHNFLERCLAGWNRGWTRVPADQPFILTGQPTLVQQFIRDVLGFYTDCKKTEGKKMLSVGVSAILMIFLAGLPSFLSKAEFSPLPAAYQNNVIIMDTQIYLEHADKARHRLVIVSDDPDSSFGIIKTILISDQGDSMELSQSGGSLQTIDIGDFNQNGKTDIAVLYGYTGSAGYGDFYLQELSGNEVKTLIHREDIANNFKLIDVNFDDMPEVIYQFHPEKWARPEQEIYTWDKWGKVLLSKTVVN